MMDPTGIILDWGERGPVAPTVCPVCGSAELKIDSYRNGHRDNEKPIRWTCLVHGHVGIVEAT